jgi:transcriptional regulator with XRE-family HTH domain
MAKPFNDLITDWPVERLSRAENRAKELIAEELTLRDLRKAHSLTQVQLAESLGIGQEHVSRMEHQSDMLLSTLAGYVRAMGGSLRLVAEFPDRPPVVIARLADAFEQDEPQPTRRGRGKTEKTKAA